MTLIESGSENEIYNISGDFEQKNKDTVQKIIKEFYGSDDNWERYIDYSYTRVGQDVRYALNDNKIRNLGWKPVKIFDEEITKIVSWYKENFRW